MHSRQPKALEILLRESAAGVAKMTPMEREQMLVAQRAGYVRAELSWPKARYQMKNGVKVYESYADYCA